MVFKVYKIINETIPPNQRIVFPRRKTTGLYKNYVDVYLSDDDIQFYGALYEVPIVTNDVDLKYLDEVRYFDLYVNIAAKEDVISFLNEYKNGKYRVNDTERIIYAIPIVHNDVIINDLYKNVAPGEYTPTLNNANELDDYLSDPTRRNVKIIETGGQNVIIIGPEGTKIINSTGGITLTKDSVVIDSMKEVVTNTSNVTKNSMIGLPVRDSKLDELIPVSDVSTKHFKWLPDFVKITKKSLEIISITGTIISVVNLINSLADSSKKIDDSKLKEAEKRIDKTQIQGRAEVDIDAPKLTMTPSKANNDPTNVSNINQKEVYKVDNKSNQKPKAVDKIKSNVTETFTNLVKKLKKKRIRNKNAKPKHSLKKVKKPIKHKHHRITKPEAARKRMEERHKKIRERIKKRKLRREKLRSQQNYRHGASAHSHSTRKIPSPSNRALNLTR